MDCQGTIEAVDKSIEELYNKFQSYPTLLFTENDIVCYFYSILWRKLPTFYDKDKDGHKHSLIHMEYPTPFRCDMRGNKDEIVWWEMVYY